MLKKIIATFIFVLSLTTATFAAKPKTKSTGLNDENYTWYEFKAKVFGVSYNFVAFKTETQRDNLALQLINTGFGVTPTETITEFFNEGAYEKTVLYNEELKPTMKDKGYKYAFTTYKKTTKDNTTLYLKTFLYDDRTDTLYVQTSMK